MSIRLARYLCPKKSETAHVTVNLVFSIVVWTGLASLIAGLMYLWDKRAAVGGRRRIPEAMLLIVSASGGWPGALLVGQRIRHKTQKLSYRVALGLCVLVNIAAVLGLLTVYG